MRIFRRQNASFVIECGIFFGYDALGNVGVLSGPSYTFRFVLFSAAPVYT